MGVSIRTVRRWIRKYRTRGISALAPGKPGPRKGTGSIPDKLMARIIHLKQKHPSWGARRIKYHSVLWQELISQVRFTSLSHFRAELRKFDRKYNHWRKNQTLGWKTPAFVYHDKRYFGKRLRMASKE